MACNQTLNGIAASCDTSKGGIKEVYLINYADIDEIAESDGVITGFTLASGATGWKKYEFKKNTGSLTSTLNVDDANGINYVTTELVLQFNKQETTKRVEMSALALAEVAVIAVDANGEAWYLGKDEPVTASAGTAQTGTARTDGNYYQITLQANDDTFPFSVASSAVPSV